MKGQHFLRNTFSIPRYPVTLFHHSCSPPIATGRYSNMHGKFVLHPVDGRRFPIICDAELVDMSFGTGAVKVRPPHGLFALSQANLESFPAHPQVTPAHDPNDFATGKRHNLEFINVFDDNGLINDRGGQFKGEPRFKVCS